MQVNHGQEKEGFDPSTKLLLLPRKKRHLDSSCHICSTKASIDDSNNVLLCNNCCGSSIVTHKMALRHELGLVLFFACVYLLRKKKKDSWRNVMVNNTFFLCRLQLLSIIVMSHDKWKLLHSAWLAYTMHSRKLSNLKFVNQIKK